MTQMLLRRADPEDLDYIMAAERRLGYEALVGRWDKDAHLAAMSDPSYRYFIADTDGVAQGFAIIRGWHSPDHVTLIKRAAIDMPGRGTGRLMISTLVSAIFKETDAYRIWIGCFPDNVRARRAYEAAGFTAEGIARGSAWFYGEHRDELILSILRTEWNQ